MDGPKTHRCPSLQGHDEGLQTLGLTENRLPLRGSVGRVVRGERDGPPSSTATTRVKWGHRHPRGRLYTELAVVVNFPPHMKPR
jgi:hypothetical protein